MKTRVRFADPDTGEATLERILNSSQETFWNSPTKFLILNGGFRSGKTEIMLLKVIFDAVTQPDNYILLGRKTYQEIYDVLLKDFIDLCPASLIRTYKKSPHPTIELNCYNSNKTSTLIFRNLDKLAEDEIKGLNLGQIAIDQAEDIPENVFNALTFRLSRKNIKHRVYLTCNPALNWLFKKCNQEKNPDWEVISIPATENYHNLPQETVDLYEGYKETDPAYYRQYVLGVWDESLLAENLVFSREHLAKLEKGIRNSLKVYEDLDIYIEPVKGRRYQMGIDCAEGLEGGDYSSITITDLDTLEEVAHWAGKLPPDATAEKAVDFAKYYSIGYPEVLMIPEMNSMGLALLNKLRDLEWTNIYQREEHDKKTGKKLLKLGWRTTSATKPLLISHFRDLLRRFEPKVHTKETVEEFKTFVYTDEVKRKGMGAQEGFHDDRIISLFLSFWEKEKRVEGSVLKKTESGEFPVETTPSLEIKNGKMKWKSPLLEINSEHKWTVC